MLSLAQTNKLQQYEIFVLKSVDLCWSYGLKRQNSVFQKDEEVFKVFYGVNLNMLRVNNPATTSS